MPRHRQVTKCRRDSGPVTPYCPCEHCTLTVCEVCGAYEGSLTTDCPGEKADFDRQQEVYKTNLDYTDERRWHQGEPMERRSPRFESVRELDPRSVKTDRPLAYGKTGGTAWFSRGSDGAIYQLPPVAAPSTDRPVALHTGHAPRVVTNEKALRIVGCACGWQMPQGVSDSDDAFALHAALHAATIGVGSTPPSPAHDQTDWARVDRTMALQHELAQKAIGWVLADRICDDHSATLALIEDEVDAHLQNRQEPNEHDRELLGKLEYEKIGFRLADQRAVKCDEEFRQAARRLVDALEKGPPTVLTMSTEREREP